MTNDPLPDRSTFSQAYSKRAPWDIGHAQPAFVARAERVNGHVLDCGCGTGELALYFAKRGLRVTAFDFLEEPIRRAKEKADTRSLSAEFEVADALRLAKRSSRFDTVLDCGLFHLFSDEDRATYVAGLTTVTKMGGRLMVVCFSDKEPGTLGPRRVTEKELRRSFADGWKCERIEPDFFEVRPDLPDYQFSNGRAHAWFAEFVRVESTELSSVQLD